MSSPQLENGFTRIANEILDALAQTDLNGTQRRILDIVIRQTYGYQRKAHDLSVSFIAKGTNLNKRQIQRELSKLIERDILIVISDATFNKSRILQFNKNFKRWQNSEVVANKTPHDTLDTHTGSGLDTSTGDYLDTQRKKERKYKDIVMTPYELEFITVLKNIKDYPLDKVKDLDYMKMLEEKYPTLDLVQAINKFSVYVLDNPFKKNANHRSQINTSFSKYTEWGVCIKEVEAPKRGPLKMVFVDSY